MTALVSQKPIHINACRSTCYLKFPLIPLPLVMSSSPFITFAQFARGQVIHEFIEWVKLHSSLQVKLMSAKLTKHAEDRMKERFPSVSMKKVIHSLHSHTDRALARCTRLCIVYGGIQVSFSKFGCCVMNVMYNVKYVQNCVPVVETDNVNILDVNAALICAKNEELLTDSQTEKLRSALSDGRCKLMKQNTLQLITPLFAFIFDELGEAMISVFPLDKGYSLVNEAIGPIFGSYNPVE
jgi:hypothetical protein